MRLYRLEVLLGRRGVFVIVSAVIWRGRDLGGRAPWGGWTEVNEYLIE